MIRVFVAEPKRPKVLKMAYVVEGDDGGTMQLYWQNDGEDYYLASFGRKWALYRRSAFQSDVHNADESPSVSQHD